MSPFLTTSLDIVVDLSNNIDNQMPSERLAMMVCYKKLWKLLIDMDIKKDLCAKAGISPASLTKMGHNSHVTTVVLEKICVVLDCRIGDVIKIIPEENAQIRAFEMN